ncbi:MAG: hypothetical protein ACI4SN_03105 [Lachnospiraceae bacterium]
MPTDFAKRLEKSIGAREDTFVKSGKGTRAGVAHKARIFEFKLDDNRYNLELHGLVLKKLGLNLYGAEVYEDYQSIYEETMKQTEKQNAGDGRRYGDKKWERGR